MGVLIHIGYHKTGTNWLQRRFFSDPATGYRSFGETFERLDRRSG